MFNLDIILDRSAKPKLSGVKPGHIWGIILSIFCTAIFLGLAINKNTKYISYTVISAVLLILFIIITIKSDNKFKKKNSIHGIMELGYFNGKEVGIFKSQYNEVIMIDFENIIEGHKSQSVTYKGKQIISVRLGNKSTTVLYSGQLIKCAIALIIKDINLINYMVQQGYIDPDNDID